MNRLTASLLLSAALVVGAATPATADHEWGGGGYYEEGDRDRNRGGGECRHAEGNCSDDDFSPTFDDSPVDRSFNPTICLPFSRCEPRSGEAEPEPSPTQP